MASEECPQGDISNISILFNYFSSISDGSQPSDSESKSGDTAGLCGNTSWSDVRRYAQQESVSSVESDIAILPSNSSRSSIAAVITESTQEQTVSSESGFTPGSNIAAISEAADNICRERVLSPVEKGGNSEGINWVMDGKGQITPVGSPLTNSICSSMVSSVYENTLAGGGDDKSVDIKHGNDEINVNGNHSSSSVDSVTLRNSGDKRGTRTSKNRNITVYSDKESSLDMSRERSIYDSMESSAINNSQNESFPSVYDTAVSDSELNSTIDDDSLTTRSFDSSMSHGLSTTNQKDSLNISSPLMRRSNHSKNNSRNNRSAIYSEVALAESEQNVDIPDFPDDLSPIKRSGARRKRNPNRMAIDKTYEVSDNLDESVEVSQATESSMEQREDSGQSLLPWEIEASRPSTLKPGRDESLNHEEFVNIDHR